MKIFYKHKKGFRPNGDSVINHPVRISISDGYVEYEYRINLKESYSIDKVYKKILSVLDMDSCDELGIRTEYIMEDSNDTN